MVIEAFAPELLALVVAVDLRALRRRYRDLSEPAHQINGMYIMWKMRPGDFDIM
jgi:hypothetical protein